MDHMSIFGGSFQNLFADRFCGYYYYYVLAKQYINGRVSNCLSFEKKNGM